MLFTNFMKLAALSLPALMFLLVPITSADAADTEVIEYRLTQQRTVHVDSAQIAAQYHDSLQKLGCESRIDEHDGHIDLIYRCPEWRDVAFDSHASAHKWETWLKSLGFEVKHSH